MRRVSKAELKDNDATYKGCVFLEPREWLDNAITGKCISTGGIIYDYDTLVEAFMSMDNITYEQASQVVDFNTNRAIPYMPEPKPIIERPKFEAQLDDDSEDDDLD